jgi:type IV secretory pathway ATPase VirB11/archaellum biosynthesis ATPase
MDARSSILVVGGMGIGETSMLRALGTRFEPLEPVVVAESVSEFRHHLHPVLGFGESRLPCCWAVG